MLNGKKNININNEIQEIIKIYGPKYFLNEIFDSFIYRNSKKYNIKKYLWIKNSKIYNYYLNNSITPSFTDNFSNELFENF